MDEFDMSQFIAPKSDQLAGDDLMGGPRTVTITRVSANPGDATQPVNFYFEGDGGKPFRPCKTMRRVIMDAWGTRASDYIGKSMTLYRDPKVQFGGMQLGGVRISHMSHIDNKHTLVVTVTQGKKAPYTVQPLKIEQAAPANTDAAAKWAVTFTAAIGRAPDLEKLETYAGNSAERIAGLPDDLRIACEAALEAKRATFATEQSEEMEPAE